MRFGYRKSILVYALVVTVIAVPGTARAATPSSSGTPTAVLQTLQRLNPEALATAVHLSPTSAGSIMLSATGSGTTATIPHDPSSGVTVSGSRARITVGLPFADHAQSAQAETTGVVSYNNGNGSTTVPIAQNDGSVQIDTIIANASAPKTFSYPVTISSGGSLTPDSDDGVDILNASGAWVAGFTPAWAKDANGRPVATHYKVDGNTLTQIVDTTPATAYPVVADPWLGQKIIDHVRWETVSKWSPTLAVFPTAFGRYRAPNAAEGAAWNEVKSMGGSRANTDTMHVQFDCHWYAVRIASPNKPSWDLDAKRPDVSLSKDGGEES
jgi:hypothetical protein